MEIPRKILNNSVFTGDVRLDKRKRFQLVISKSGILFEINDKSEIKSEPLLGEDFDETGLDLTKTQISFQIFHSHLSYKPEAYYLIHFVEPKKLVVVKRVSHNGDRELTLLQTLERVESVQIKALPTAGESLSRNRGAKVHINFLDTKTPLMTDFSDHGGESLPKLDGHMMVTYQKCRQVTMDAQASLLEEGAKLRELMADSCARLKFVPTELRSPNPAENTPLVQYGSCWQRIYNEQVIVGIPVLNTTRER